MVRDMDAPIVDDETTPEFTFRLYGPQGEITTFTTSIGGWETGEVLTLRDGRRFEITSISPVSGGSVDGLFQVSQVE